MNILLESTNEKASSKKSNVKAILALRRQFKSTDQQPHPYIPQQQKVSEHKIPAFSQDKSKDFSTIFGKQKRHENSGYKQIYLNQSSVIKVRQEQRPIYRYENSRKYQTKLKNIAKLRKRQSLQPINIHQSPRRKQTINELQLKMNSYRQAKPESIQTNRHMTSEKAIVNTQPIAELSERVRLKKINHITRTHQQLMLPKLNCVPQDMVIIQKPNWTQIKKNIKVKTQLTQKKRQLTLQQELIQPNQEANELHGWSTQSFYPIKVFPYFKDSQN